jgi:hypothetical protein
MFHSLRQLACLLAVKDKHKDTHELHTQHHLGLHELNDNHQKNPQIKHENQQRHPDKTPRFYADWTDLQQPTTAVISP